MSSRLRRISSANELDILEPEFSGNLHYRNRLNRWQTRFVSIEGASMYVYSHRNASTPRYCLPLSPDTILEVGNSIKVTTRHRDTAFSIAHNKNKRVFLFRSKSEQERECWTTVVNRAKAWGSSKPKITSSQLSYTSLDGLDDTSTVSTISRMSSASRNKMFTSDSTSRGKILGSTVTSSAAVASMLALGIDIMPETEDEGGTTVDPYSSVETALAHCQVAFGILMSMRESSAVSDDIKSSINRVYVAVLESTRSFIAGVATLEEECDKTKVDQEEATKELESLQSHFTILARQQLKMEHTASRRIKHNIETARNSTGPAGLSMDIPITTIIPPQFDNISVENISIKQSDSSAPESLPVPYDSGESLDDENDEFFDAVERVNSVSSSHSRISTCVSRTRQRSVALMEAHRTMLPARISDSIPSMWKVLKANIGKDMSKIAFPIEFNEPISGLQRLTEDLEYTELLDKAAALPPNSIDRIVMVAAYAISCYSSLAGRTRKPFNPLLGETYSLDLKEKGFRSVSEQVSHHPPIYAMYAFSMHDKWKLWQHSAPKSNMKGKYMELDSGVSARLLIDSEAFSWTKAQSRINNIVVGKLWLETVGHVEVNSLSCDKSVSITFKKYSHFGRSNVGDVEAVVSDGSKLSGNWNDALTWLKCDGTSELLWTRNVQVPNSESYYEFTNFALMLNELLKKEIVIPQTDTRFRPDIRLYEEGKNSEASEVKDRLEEKQRSKARVAKASGKLWKPIYFSESPASKVTGIADDDGKLWDYLGGCLCGEETRKDTPCIF